MPPDLAEAGVLPPARAAMAGPRHEAPRVVLCTDSAEPSGMGTHMLALATGLRPACTPLIACPPSPGGGRLMGAAAARGIAVRPIDPKDEAGLVLWLRQSGADIAHIHAGIGWEGHGLVRAARRAGLPVVLRTEHLPYVVTEPRQQREHREAAALADCVICVSRAVRDSHVAAGLPADRLVTVRNGIAPSSAQAGRRPHLRAALGLAPGAPVMLTVARMTAQKGHADLIEAARLVRAQRPDAAFLLVGAGPLREELQERARARGLDRAVLFLGQRRDVPDLLAAADLFVLPSRFEGLPLVVLEAMAASLAVVATRIGGTEEAVADGATGLLAPPGDPAALAGAICALIGAPARRRRMGAAGLARFHAEFGAARMAGEILDLYRRLAPLAGFGPRAVPA